MCTIIHIYSFKKSYYSWFPGFLFLHSLSQSWSLHTIQITDLSYLLKLDNLHNQWLPNTLCFFMSFTCLFYRSASLPELFPPILAITQHVSTCLAFFGIWINQRWRHFFLHYSFLCFPECPGYWSREPVLFSTPFEKFSFVPDCYLLHPAF